MQRSGRSAVTAHEQQRARCSEVARKDAAPTASDSFGSRGVLSRSEFWPRAATDQFEGASAPVSMKSVCQTAKKQRGPRPLKRPRTPSLLATCLSTATRLSGASPADARACARQMRLLSRRRQPVAETSNPYQSCASNLEPLYPKPLTSSIDPEPPVPHLDPKSPISCPHSQATNLTASVPRHQRSASMSASSP